MKHKISHCIILLAVKMISGKQSTTELPLCPTNIQYFPQNLPMHCRMPNPPSNNQPFSFPMPPGMPISFPLSGPMPMQESVPSPRSMPEAMPKPEPVPMPGPMPMQGPVPMPLPGMPMLPMAPPGPAHKLPVIVMPFYSPDPVNKRKGSRKRRRPLKRSSNFHTDTDTDTSTSSETDTDSSTSSDTSSDRGHGWWKPSKGFQRNARRLNRRHKLRKKKHAKKDLLTPILQFVSKDGYVIFEKQISQGEAKQWLKGNSNTNKVKNVKSDDIKEPTEYNDTSEHGVPVADEEANIEKVKSNTFMVKNPRIAVTKHRQQKPYHSIKTMRPHR